VWAAESVAAHGGEAAFWTMHDTIFEHQRDSAIALSDQHLAEYATRTPSRARSGTRPRADASITNT
jgi:protein-disulfide isomerase